MKHFKFSCNKNELEYFKWLFFEKGATIDNVETGHVVDQFGKIISEIIIVHGSIPERKYENIVPSGFIFLD